MHIHHPSLQHVALKLILPESFDKDVCNLIFSPVVFHDDVSLLNIISPEVMPDINMLGSFMLDWILSHVGCTGIITH